MSQTATRISIRGNVDVTRTTRHVACRERFREPMVNRNVSGYTSFYSYFQTVHQVGPIMVPLICQRIILMDKVPFHFGLHILFLFLSKGKDKSFNQSNLSMVRSNKRFTFVQLVQIPVKSVVCVPLGLKHDYRL